MSETEAISKRVAKFGGTSAARPDVVMGHIANGSAGGINVISAAGSDEDKPRTTRMTEMLRRYQQTQDDELFEDIILRLKEVGDRAGIDVDDYIDPLEDIRTWHWDSWPALGEFWSAKIVAGGLQRIGHPAKFVDATELIRFGGDNVLDYEKTYRTAALQLGEFASSATIIVPGFYGINDFGEKRLLPSGGSDLTGALLAHVIMADEYQNWSDVDGFRFADPRLFPGARLNTSITYDEKRELGNGGNGLLHAEVSRILSGKGISTRMMNTFGENNETTSVVDVRHDIAERPLVGATLRSMSELCIAAVDNKVGTTDHVFVLLARAGVPYHHLTSAQDAVSIYIDRDREDDALAAVGYRVQKTKTVEAVHVVGEGLRADDSRRVTAALELKLADAGISDGGEVNMGSLPAKTFMVPPGQGKRAIESVMEL